MRYVVVGLGNIGGRRRALLGERCVATADPFNAAADYRSVRDVPTDAFDAAVLAIPDDDKVDLVTYLLERGKHVLVEKPLPLPDEATARRLESLARARGLLLYTAYNHRFEPMLSAFQEQVAAGTIGEVYHGRLFYGNGTVKHVAGTWRDQGLGVIQDLGCHLLDLLAYVGLGGGEMRLVAAQSIESQAPDRALIASADGRFTLEVMYHAWRNSFAFELYGELGSIHCFGLRKWGGSEVIVRLRVLPSGRPYEGRDTDEGPDETWEYELRHFESLIKELQFEQSMGDLANPNADCYTDLSTDWWIARTLRSLGTQLEIMK